jgi:hypothetical protein
MMKDLANAYARDHNDYTKTLNAAISMVSSYTGKTERKATYKYDPKNKEQQPAVGFVQKGEPVKNGEWHQLQLWQERPLCIQMSFVTMAKQNKKPWDFKSLTERQHSSKVSMPVRNCRIVLTIC